MKLSILIPAYNEEKTIYSLLEKVGKVALLNDMDKEIIIINDCSTDKTEEQVYLFFANYPDLPLLYFKQETNQGKGAAIHVGISAAAGDYIIIQDADLEYNPEDYNVLLEYLLHTGAKVVYGSRFMNAANKHSYTRFYLGGRFVSWLTNVLYAQNITDEPTCYKMFDARFLKSIPLKGNGFEFCPEVTAKVAKMGIKIKELPICYYPRSIEEGKKINWKDGAIAIWTLVKYRIIP